DVKRVAVDKGKQRFPGVSEGAPAQITLYSDNKTLRGHVSSIGRAIYDQSVESDSSLIPDVKPNVPWVRLAQRVPVRFALDKVPGNATGGARHQR
ncbi:HlyD family secretion protein, partial [Escherichia sp. R-CC3]